MSCAVDDMVCGMASASLIGRLHDVVRAVARPWRAPPRPPRRRCRASRRGLRHRDHPAIGRAGQRADRVVGAVHHQLGPQLGLDVVGDLDRHAAAVKVRRSRPVRAPAAGSSASSSLPDHQIAAAGVPHVPGSRHVRRRHRPARHHRFLTCRRMRSTLSTPFCRLRTTASGARCGAICARGVLGVEAFDAEQDQPAPRDRGRFRWWPRAECASRGRCFEATVRCG